MVSFSLWIISLDLKDIVVSDNEYLHEYVIIVALLSLHPCPYLPPPNHEAVAESPLQRRAET